MEMTFEPLTLPPNKLVKLCIQGMPGTGKTFAACSFPNPHFICLEHTLPDSLDALKYHNYNVEAIKVFPFYKSDWIVNFLKSKKAIKTHTDISKVLLVRDAVKLFIKEECIKYSNPNMTWVLDSWSQLHDWFDLATWDEPTYDQQGKEKPWVPWDLKIDYSQEILNNLMTQDSNIVVIVHEAQDRDKVTGQLLQKTQPAMQGKFQTRLKEKFPNYYRSLIRPRLDSGGKEIMNPETKRIEVDYVWQVGPSLDFDPKCTKPGLPTYIKADYKSLL